MKGTLHKTEEGWVVRWPREDPRDPVPELPVHPDDLDSGIIRWAEIGGLGDKEIEFDWCVIVTPDGKGKGYARLTKPKRSIDLQNLETKLDQALSEETDWTLSKWLKSKRDQKELISEIMNDDAKDGLYDVMEVVENDVEKSAVDFLISTFSHNDILDHKRIRSNKQLYNLYLRLKKQAKEMELKAKSTLYTEEQAKEPIKEMIKFIDDINDNDRSEFNYYYDHIMDKLKELLESKKD